MDNTKIMDALKNRKPIQQKPLLGIMEKLTENRKRIEIPAPRAIPRKVMPVRPAPIPYKPQPIDPGFNRPQPGKPVPMPVRPMPDIKRPMPVITRPGGPMPSPAPMPIRPMPAPRPMPDMTKKIMPKLLDAKKRQI